MAKLISAKDHGTILRVRKGDFTKEEYSSLTELNLNNLSCLEVLKIVGPLRVFWWFAYLPRKDRGILILKMLQKLIDVRGSGKIDETATEIMVFQSLDESAIVLKSKEVNEITDKIKALQKHVHFLIQRLEEITSGIGIQSSPGIAAKFRTAHAFLAAIKCVLDQHFLYSVALNFGEVFGEIDKPQFSYYPKKPELNKIIESFLED